MTVSEEVKETYSISYSEEEILELSKLMHTKLRKTIIKDVLLLCALFVLCVGVKDAPQFTWVVLGFAICVNMVAIRNYSLSKKAWKESSENVSQSTYIYEIFTEYFKISIYRNEELVSYSKIDYTELQGVQDLGKYLVLVHSNKAYIFRKAELREGSVLYRINIKSKMGK